MDKALTECHPAFAAGNLALITGASSGIGRAATHTYISAGIYVAMVDIDEKDLAATFAELEPIAKAANAQLKKYVCDVGSLEQMQGLRQQVEADFSGIRISILMNNAGKNGFARKIEDDRKLWDNVLATNMMGVINGTQVFLPHMKQGDAPGLIINTGSKQGITAPPGNLCYNVAKSAVKTFTEGLHYELREEKPNLNCFLLVPGWTNTSIQVKSDQEAGLTREMFSEANPSKGAWMPQQVVDFMLKTIQEGKFYIICPDNDVTREVDNARMTWAMQDITQDRPPLSRWHPEWKDKFTDYVKDKLPSFVPDVKTTTQ